MKSLNSYFVAFRQFPAAFVAILTWATHLLLVAAVAVAGMSAQVEGTSSSSSVSACNDVLTLFSRELTQAARNAGVQDIALVRFMCNGGGATSLSDNVQSVLLEDLLEEDNPIPLTDRSNERYIEVENSLAGIAGDTAAASAVLTGEVFFAPGDAIGICTVRLFRVSDCRILYAGCSFVQWSTEEAMLMGGQSAALSRHSFARLDNTSFQKLRKQAGRIGADFAFVQDTAQNSTNTLNLRATCAQILATLAANGAQAYEREFFTLAATEQARDGQSVFDTNCKASAIALVKPHAATDGNLALTFQVQSTSTRRLLKNIRLNTQTVGTAGNAIVDGGGNDFDSNNALLEQELRATTPIAEVECMVPQEAMRQYHQQCFRYYNGDCAKIKRALEVAAIRGFVYDAGVEGKIWIRLIPDPNIEIRESGYVGPLPNCAVELNRQYELARNGSQPVSVYLGTDDKIYNLSAREFLHGIWDDEVRYTYSITWKDGLPYKAKARLDLTPIKDKLLKRAPQTEE